MKFDIHTNLGIFPSSSVANSKPQLCDAEMLADHLRKFNITHHLCLYSRDGYDELVKLKELCPDVTHYGVQCVFGYEENNPTNVDTLKLDRLDPNKDLCVGVKFHSHRGYWERQSTQFVREQTLVGSSKHYVKEKITTVESGLDYYNDKIVRQILEQLPENSIASFHTQGTPTPNKAYSTPLTVATLASKFPHLKFIINHCGDYGVTNAKPSYIKDFKTGVYTGYMDTMVSYTQSRAAFHAAAEFANHMHNVFLDSSNYVKQKAEILAMTDKWTIGTDIPFGAEAIYSHTNEEKKFAKLLGQKAVEDSYAAAVHFFETDHEQLLDEMAVRQNIYARRVAKGIRE